MTTDPQFDFAHTRSNRTRSFLVALLVSSLGSVGLASSAGATHVEPTPPCSTSHTDFERMPPPSWEPNWPPDDTLDGLDIQIFEHLWQVPDTVHIHQPAGPQ